MTKLHSANGTDVQEEERDMSNLDCTIQNEDDDDLEFPSPTEETYGSFYTAFAFFNKALFCAPGALIIHGSPFTPFSLAR